MNSRITIRFTAAEVKLLRRAARERGVGVSELLRLVALEALRPVPVVDVVAAREPAPSRREAVPA